MGEWSLVGIDADCPDCGKDNYDETTGNCNKYAEYEAVPDDKYLEGFRYDMLRFMCPDCYQCLTQSKNT